MVVGIAQMDIYWMNAEKSKEKCTAFFAEAKSQNVDLLIFPEMTLTGFSMDTAETVRQNADTLQFFSKEAAKHELCTIFGQTASSTGSLGKNQCIALDRQGELLCEYTKIHPFSYAKEDLHYEKGCSPSFFSLEHLTFSTFICYDLRFPEIFALAAPNVQAQIVIANWPKSRIEHWDALLRARAIETQCYIAGANRVGDGDNLAYCGHSAIYAPNGDCLTALSEDEGLITAEISLESVLDERKRFPVLNDKRWDLYPLVAKTLTQCGGLGADA